MEFCCSLIFQGCSKMEQGCSITKILFIHSCSQGMSTMDFKVNVILFNYQKPNIKCWKLKILINFFKVNVFRFLMYFCRVVLYLFIVVQNCNWVVPNRYQGCSNSCRVVSKFKYSTVLELRSSIFKYIFFTFFLPYIRFQ